MKITHYSFGNIQIDGKTYSKDVIIFPDHVFSPWWRKEGHALYEEDLSEVLSSNIRTLIIGTGYHGTMQVPQATLDFLKSKDIKTYVETTRKAVELFNKTSSENTAAALHLTC